MRCLACACLWLAGSAAAADFAYRVEIHAPAALVKVLEANLDIVRWSARAETQPEQLDLLYRGAPAQIRALLETEGYFAPAIDAALDSASQPPLARFRIEPGEPVRIARTTLNFRGALLEDADRDARLERARAAWPLKDGALFRQRDWEAAKRGLLREIDRYRYANAKIVNSRARIDPVARTAELEVEIDSGPPLTFGGVEVHGVRRYPAKLVADLNPIPNGAPYSEEELSRYQRRLITSRYFASALVTANAETEETRQVPIRVDVVEVQAQTFEAGIGLSTDKGPRGFLNHTHRSVNAAGWALVSRLQLDPLEQKASTMLHTPQDAAGLHYSFGGRIEAADIQGQKTTNVGFVTSRTRSDERNESALALQLEIERQEAGDAAPDNRQALFLNQSRLWNRTDNILQPRAGHALYAELGGAAQALGSTRSFLRAYSRASWMLPLGNSDTVVLRGQLGLVGAQGRDGIPSTYLFRTGGDTTVRGYAYESLGVPQNGAVVGGRYLAVASAEYIHWITREWGAAVFVDAGNAVDSLSDFRAAKGYGAGVRWSSKLGALNLDLAYGQDTQQYRVHFSMGITFK